MKVLLKAGNFLRLHLFNFRRPVDGLVVDVDVDAGYNEWRHVGAVEGVQTSGVDLHRAVATHKVMPIKEL